MLLNLQLMRGCTVSLPIMLFHTDYLITTSGKCMWFKKNVLYAIYVFVLMHATTMGSVKWVAFALVFLWVDLAVWPRFPRETALLIDPKNSCSSSRQWVALVVGHELAHQWFGNLVTMVNNRCAPYCLCRNRKHSAGQWPKDMIMKDITWLKMKLYEQLSSIALSWIGFSQYDPPPCLVGMVDPSVA